jgi:hypothetical protein
MTEHQNVNHTKRLIKPLFLVPTKEQVVNAQELNRTLWYMESQPCAAEAKSEALQLVSNSLVGDPS